jgi:hypothetical protein
MTSLRDIVVVDGTFIHYWMVNICPINVLSMSLRFCERDHTRSVLMSHKRFQAVSVRKPAGALYVNVFHIFAGLVLHLKHRVAPQLPVVPAPPCIRRLSACEGRPRRFGGVQRGGGTCNANISRTVQRWSVIPAAMVGVLWVATVPVAWAARWRLAHRAGAAKFMGINIARSITSPPVQDTPA